ncbi:hypothetical protein CXB77_11725 [Chromatium okenii]|uniref:Uncharacterized protein n=2 Tax=Chromatium okenii TaxID=61644 RepID=A0A2S7XQ36_9GAMM|nr:hypothetical protein CXB77_11725 [Chromatium okenii]
MRGLQYGFEGLRENAADIASKQRIEGVSSTNIDKPLTSSISTRQQIEAATKLMDAGTQMFRTTFHITA